MSMDFHRLRQSIEGQSGSFEEFCCQLFARAPEAPNNGRFVRIRGAGGDGGVEAIWEADAKAVWGLQAKFFFALGTSQKGQMRESLDEAVANYPTLTHYTFCLPFTLTSKKGAKSKRVRTGQRQTIETWFKEWQRKLNAAGRRLLIDLWDSSELLNRLTLADPHGGMRRYWFDEKILSVTWRTNHLKDALAQAGKRYTPELSVETPLSSQLDCFGKADIWSNRLGAISKTLKRTVEWWQSTIAATDPSMSGKLPEPLRVDGERLLTSAKILQSLFEAFIADPTQRQSSPILSEIKDTLDQAINLEPPLRSALIKLHGENADTKGFRQFSAEFMVSFPMAPLDHLRDLIAVLRDVDERVVGIDGRLAAETAMLVRGPAGIGKTHGIIDAALQRQKSDLLSIVMFGEDFSNNDPWGTIASKLGFGSSIARDELLDAIESAAEASGFPAIIFIDALNETLPDRRKWKSWLPPIIEQITRRRLLRLCVTCRDIYIRDVAPDALDLPTVEHNGFGGNEYKAISEFFHFYGLQIPAEPIFQDEFSNPLFLHLVCSAIQQTGQHSVPAGVQGIKAIINLLLVSKNEKAAQLCDYDPRAKNRVRAALLALAKRMAENGTRLIPLSEAAITVNGGRSPKKHSTSLFSVLEQESLISIIERHSSDSIGSTPSHEVRFTFERMGDHLIAEQLLSKADEDVRLALGQGGTIHFAVRNDEEAIANGGLLEALAIQIAERHGRELSDLVDTVDKNILLGYILSGVSWRDATSISSRTIWLIQRCLSTPDLSHKAIEAVLKLSARPRHPLNANFLDRLLRHTSMLGRDPYWAYHLEQSFAGTLANRSSGAAFRLINWALNDEFAKITRDVAELWSTTLAWFCASPDRRIRDRATKGLVRVFRACPSAVPTLIAKFVDVDDEYVAERVLVSSYGALLLRPDIDALRESASMISAAFFETSEPPLNASLRDHGRLIIELAVEVGAAPKDLNLERCRPPYRSPWPIALPSESAVEQYVKDKKRYPEMSLAKQFGLALGTDFARYIVEPRVINEFDVTRAGLDKEGIFRWFLQKAVDLGYPGPNDQCAHYDHSVLAEHGGGRAKPGWAERLGKKYYWILLRQLVGQIADHLPRNEWPAKKIEPSSDLQSMDLRDLDPSDTRDFEPQPQQPHQDWFIALPYITKIPDTLEHDAPWMKAADLIDLKKMLLVKDAKAVSWQVLSLQVEWNGLRRGRNEESKESYRHLYRVMYALTCELKDVPKLTARCSKKKWSVDMSSVEPFDYRGYLGEYPRGWAYQQRFATDFSFERTEQGVKLEAATLRQLRGREWGYDHSSEGETPSMTMPCPRLVDAGDLRWDGRGDWNDKDGLTQISCPTWYRSENQVLIGRLDYIDRVLKENGRALVVFGFQTKYVVQGSGDGRGSVDQWSAYVRAKGVTKLIGKTEKRWAGG